MLNRRRFVELVSAASGVVPALPSYLMQCPPRPRGGERFEAGRDARPIVARKPLSAYSQADIVRLRKAYAAMRALPRRDPRSWLTQADLHASHCGQCTDSADQVHGSWAFLPWHRAFLYFHERILGSLAGDPDGFRLPCWEWENQRAFPAAYSVPPNGGNALWDSQRNARLSAGGDLPAGDALPDRLALLEGITDFLTFGGGADSGGAVEIDPHNVMHLNIGMQEPPWRDMGRLGFSARDPLFYAHHANVDKLWHRWNASGGKNPSEERFLAMRWTFYDERAQAVSISASDLLDHASNLRYEYGPAGARSGPAPLSEVHDCRLLCCARTGAVVQANREVRERVLGAAERGSKIALVVPRLSLPVEFSGSFDVIAYGEGRRTPLGGLVFSDDPMFSGKGRCTALVLDATEAIRGLLALKHPAAIYALARYGGNPFAFGTQAAQLRVASR